MRKDTRLPCIRTILVIVAAAAVSFSAAVNTGCKKGPGDYFGYWYGHGAGAGCFPTLDEMKENLDLNSRQVEKIEKIDNRYRKSYRENRGDFDTVERLREKHRSAVEEVLKPEQLREYNREYKNRWFCGTGRMYGTRPMMSNRWDVEGAHQRGYHRGHGHSMGHGAGCFRNMASMSGVLDLNESQEKKIEEIDSRFRESYYRNRGERDTIDRLKDEHRSAIEKVLTPAQREVFREYYYRHHRC